MARYRMQGRPSQGEGRAQGDESKAGLAGAVADAETSKSSTTFSPEFGDKLKRGPKGAAVEWLMMLVLVGYSCFLVNVYHSDHLPRPLSAVEAGTGGFAEETAWEHVSSLVKLGPHPVGSKALESAFQYVHGELIKIKEAADDYVDVEVVVFEPGPGLERLAGGLFYGKSLVYTNLKYLVVRISPADFPESKENAVLVSSHIDTVVTSAGAGDCSSCVAVLLELVRALSHWAGGFKHSIIFLFNTGEEEGLIGAHSFITQHPWNATVRAVIDVESMGTGGKSILFQAGPDKWLLQLYAKVAKYPAAQIVAQDVFHFGLVKSATDFQVYREVGGLSGLDFAFIENGAVYHTRNDKIELLRAGSLQHIGEELLALLQASALSDELQYSRINSSVTEKMEMVYFDVLGKWMITYPMATARTMQTSLISQALVLFFSSLYLSGYSAFIEFGLALVTIVLTWIFAIASVIIVATVLPYVSYCPAPYIAHPWLVIGLFGSPAVFGALLGNSLGRFMLVKYLQKKGLTEKHSRWHAERWLFKAGIFQWIVVLSLGTWVNAGSSYIAVFWVLPPALAYGWREAQFSPRQTLRGLQRGTLWLSMVPGLAISAVPVIHLTAVLIGNLARFDRNPGGVPLWLANALIGVSIAAYTCLMLIYLFPYAHRAGGLVWILMVLAAVFIVPLLMVIAQLVPAFTEHVGRGIQAVHVIDRTGLIASEQNPRQYISLSAVTPGNFQKEMAFLDKDNFICGPTAIDFVTHNVKYGCTKPLEDDGYLSRGQPTLQIEKDNLIDGQRVTSVRFSSGSGHRWNLAINTNAVEAFKLEWVLDEQGGVLVPGGTILGVDGWHNVQFITDDRGPSQFELTLFWHSTFQEGTHYQWDSKMLLLKLRTDVNVVTDELEQVLKKLPRWCVLFGKSTSPYTLSYLADLKMPLPSMDA